MITRIFWGAAALKIRCAKSELFCTWKLHISGTFGGPYIDATVSAYHINTKYWLSASELPSLVDAISGAVGVSSICSVDQYVVLLPEFRHDKCQQGTLWKPIRNRIAHI